MEITLSIIKADTGGYVGHGDVHPDLLATASRALKAAVEDGRLRDGQVNRVGDDLALIMTHTHGTESQVVHGLAWEVFEATTGVARKLGLYGAGQDLLGDAFSGNLRGLGPGYAEMTFEERPSEPVVVFLADKTEPGAFNYPLARMFADPFSSPGLVIDTKMHAGFAFEVLDLKRSRHLTLVTPEEYYDLLMLIGAPHRFVVRQVRSRALDTVAAATSVQRLSLIAGRYVGKDDPVLAVRAQSGLPAVGEVLEPFALPHLVGGWMRGSHFGPLMPCGIADATPSRFDGPPRIVAIGYQVTDGRLIGPRDLFADPGFDRARQMALELADHLRRTGPFEPHRAGLDELEYTTMPALFEALAERWTPEGTPAPVRS
ncbi:MAG TPA: fructose-1,6-bisphosphate aldolase/phosphatase [Candidatus Dormibacteraeota bacterium]|jgi:fructose 1,6-bisphosphate aldolase/phosphatase|nr:fructose-1,6-bisphosphate aldolase/phosphatase [Candidatus Dormibacteraeota bacterium]